jgi:four helix bundle protein
MASPFIAYDVSLALVRAVEPLLGVLGRRNPPLADQLCRAATSVHLNLAEGNRRAGKDRGQMFRHALGSASEVQACLEVAEALKYLRAPDFADALAKADRAQRLLRVLTR